MKIIKLFFKDEHCCAQFFYNFFKFRLTENVVVPQSFTRKLLKTVGSWSP